MIITESGDTIASFSVSFLYLCLFSTACVNYHRPCKHSNVRYGLVSSAPVSAVGLACSNARTSSCVRIVVLARSVVLSCGVLQ